jgi:hypothetical protein
MAKTEEQYQWSDAEVKVMGGVCGLRKVLSSGYKRKL